jgi:gliding motility-associated-like protein
MGFAASTGGAYAIHEVRDVIARTPGDLYVNIPELETPCIDPLDTTAIKVKVVNGLSEATGITICDTLPAGFTLLDVPTATSNSSTCVVTLYNFTQTLLPDMRLLCCYSLDMSSYGEVIINYDGTFSPGSYPDSVTIGSSLVPPPLNFTDFNLDDNSATITVPMVRYDTVSAEICIGQSYNFNGIAYSDSGFHTQTYTAINGCDSLITLHLKLKICEVFDTISEVICEGTTYDFNGKMLTEQNTYTDTLPTIYGGDSIITLYLTVNPIYHIAFNDVVCAGKPYHKYGFNLAAHDSAGTYTYERLLQTVNGCDSLRTLTLQVPEVTVAISSSNPDFCNTYETTLSAITPNSKVQWNTGATSTDIDVTHSGSYSVTAYENDCTAFAAYAVEECPIAIVFPNAITPENQDGINDYFYLPAADAVYEFSLFIYDRWGECVFSSVDSRFRWDGTVKGKIAQGVYTYVVTYRADNDKKARSARGTVTVY